MTELICSQGHVIDPGRELCSRCNGVAVNAGIVAEEAVLPTEVAGNAPKEIATESAPKKVKKAKKVEVKKVKKGKKK